jgi:hypothetical protein
VLSSFEGIYKKCTIEMGVFSEVIINDIPGEDILDISLSNLIVPLKQGDDSGTAIRFERRMAVEKLRDEADLTKF